MGNNNHKPDQEQLDAENLLVTQLLPEVQSVLQQAWEALGRNEPVDLPVESIANFKMTINLDRVYSNMHSPFSDQSSRRCVWFYANFQPTINGIPQVGVVTVRSDQTRVNDEGQYIYDVDGIQKVLVEYLTLIGEQEGLPGRSVHSTAVLSQLADQEIEHSKPQILDMLRRDMGLNRVQGEQLLMIIRSSHPEAGVDDLVKKCVLRGFKPSTEQLNKVQELLKGGK